MYKGYKNYTNHKSYNSGVKIASFICGLLEARKEFSIAKQEKKKAQQEIIDKMICAILTMISSDK